MFWAAHVLHWQVQRASCPDLKGMGNLFKTCRAWDRCLQLFIFNEDCLVSARHQRALNTTLYSVHTARRSYRLKFSVSWQEEFFETGSLVDFSSKCQRIDGFRGRRSRNKVSVGEPAEGSFTVISIPFFNLLNKKKKKLFFFFFLEFLQNKNTEFHKFLAVDLLVLATMKSVAKYDKSCELQDSVNHQILEHKWLP